MAGSGQRTGIANLPLHYGKVPPWLFERMCQLAREITIVTVTEFGTSEVKRLACHPHLNPLPSRERRLLLPDKSGLTMTWGSKGSKSGSK